MTLSGPYIDCRTHPVGRHGALTRVWAKRDSQPHAPSDCHYGWGYIFGAVRPAPERAGSYPR